MLHIDMLVQSFGVWFEKIQSIHIELSSPRSRRVNVWRSRVHLHDFRHPIAFCGY